MGGDCVLATQPGARVVPDCATSVTLLDDGDYWGPPAPAGSECEGESSYTLALPGGDLSWSKCVFDATPWQLEQGVRTLTAQELAGALAGLHAVTVWDRQYACGADASTLTIEVVTPAGTRSYTDSFYSCSNLATIYVDNIDAAFGALGDLAHP
jgi:hypothetical protein